MYPEALRSLATILARRVKEMPYHLLLSSTISLTDEVCEAMTGSTDRHALDDLLEPMGIMDRCVFLRDYITGRGNEIGYHFLASMIKLGYFRVILTANLDSSLEDALTDFGMKPSEYRVLVCGQDKDEYIAGALQRRSSMVEIVKLRGDLVSQTLPPSISGFFRFSHALEGALGQYLNQDILIVGEMRYDDDIHRIIGQEGGMIWYIVPAAPRSDDFVFRSIKARGTGRVVHGKYGQFNEFFSVLKGLVSGQEIAPPGPLSSEGKTPSMPEVVPRPPDSSTGKLARSVDSEKTEPVEQAPVEKASSGSPQRVEVAPTSPESDPPGSGSSRDVSLKEVVVRLIAALMGVLGLLFGVALFINYTPSFETQFVIPLLAVLAVIVLGTLGILSPKQLSSLLALPFRVFSVKQPPAEDANDLSSSDEIT